MRWVDSDRKILRRRVGPLFAFWSSAVGSEILPAPRRSPRHKVGQGGELWGQWCSVSDQISFVDG